MEQTDEDEAGLPGGERPADLSCNVSVARLEELGESVLVLARQVVAVRAEGVDHLLDRFVLLEQQRRIFRAGQAPALVH